jgi:hypothetical protein
VQIDISLTSLTDLERYRDQTASVRAAGQRGRGEAGRLCPYRSSPARSPTQSEWTPAMDAQLIDLFSSLTAVESKRRESVRPCALAARAGASPSHGLH